MMEPIGEASILMAMLPRDLSSDSVRIAESKSSDDGFYHSLREDDSPPRGKSSRSINYICINGKSPSPNDEKITSSAKKSSRIKLKKKNSIGSADGHQYLEINPQNTKSHSLPPNASIQDIDHTIISALRIQPEEIASQLTLLDIQVFAMIKMDELTSCAWTKKNKVIVTPNIVAFTRRFNHTSFWTVQEILNGSRLVA